MGQDKIFRFRQFSLGHGRCAHPIGTDGVLLGAWAAHPRPRRILDVGSGCGLVAFMLAQRYPEATFLGLDRHRPSVAQARENLVASPFAARGAFAEGSFPHQPEEGDFNLIVSNPPFFRAQVASPWPEREMARRMDALPPAELLRGAGERLAPGGRLALIYPPQEAAELAQLAQKTGWHRQRRTLVRSYAARPVKRVLSSWQREPVAAKEDYLILYQAPSQRHAQFAALTAEFYP